MSLVALSQQDEFGLAHSDQDCRGWPVVDATGQTLGTCTDMIIDTEAEHVDSIVLETGAQIAAVDITLQHGTVRVGNASGLMVDGAATINRSADPVATASRGSSGDSVRHDHLGGDTAQSAELGMRDSGLEDVTLPVIEERIKVGKREVQSGGVRVTQRVTDQPVEETVTLRTEQVHVERRPVNQPAEAVGVDTFKEGMLEVLETDEEAVVAKQARVVEEVVVRKDVTERTETIRDTVKRTDVDVEQLAGDAARAEKRSTKKKKSQ